MLGSSTFPALGGWVLGDGARRRFVMCEVFTFVYLTVHPRYLLSAVSLVSGAGQQGGRDNGEWRGHSSTGELRDSRKTANHAEGSKQDHRDPSVS